MHIVHFCGALKGGPLSAIAELTRQQVAAGNCVSLVYSPLRDPAGTFRGDLPVEVELHPLAIAREIRPYQDVQAVLGLRAIAKTIRPDILHLHSSKAGAIGRIAGHLSGIPSVYSTHGMSYLRTDVPLLSRALFYGIECVLGPLGSVTVACSPSELKTMWAIPGHKTDIPNGIDLAGFPFRPARPSHDGLEIVLCGRITAQKNPALACRIAALSPPSWRWTWLGGGEMEEMVRAGGRIAVTGWVPRSDAISRLLASDVMVHTSSWEGMPIAILEAMAAGLPVVATNVVGNRDLVVSGETGFTAQGEADLLEKLKVLAASPEMRRKMGAAGRRRAEKNFNQARLKQSWTALYEQLVARPKQ